MFLVSFILFLPGMILCFFNLACFYVFLSLSSHLYFILSVFVTNKRTYFVDSRSNCTFTGCDRLLAW